MNELARIMEYGLCHEDVTRKGESQPCEKTAVAVRIDPGDGGPYPVCAFHARGRMVPLSDLLAAVSGEGRAGGLTYRLLSAQQETNMQVAQ